MPFVCLLTGILPQDAPPWEALQHNCLEAGGGTFPRLCRLLAETTHFYSFCEGMDYRLWSNLGRLLQLSPSWKVGARALHGAECKLPRGCHIDACYPQGCVMVCGAKSYFKGYGNRPAAALEDWGMGRVELVGDVFEVTSEGQLRSVARCYCASDSVTAASFPCVPS